jgi:hypothetical protein
VTTCKVATKVINGAATKVWWSTLRDIFQDEAGLRMLRYVGGDKCRVESKCRKRMSEANVEND